ncbi:unnamed protein product [Paramecium sonneborni]|uniref:Dynein light chain n=1 Tax=Paramecium sonneborni TaxID=65129 RepID=A0A8S1K6I1_9CILI|nr:unnamed protein product [Paramecium sonneborni]
MEEKKETQDLVQLKKEMLGTAIIKDTDMSPDMLSEVQDSIVSGIENNSSPVLSIENACKTIKEALEKKYGPTWQVIIGEGYAYDVTVQNNTRLFMFYNGNLACLVFKS